MLIRKTVKSGPVRITLSPRGLSEGVGGQWWRLQAGGIGPHHSLRIPRYRYLNPPTSSSRALADLA